MTRHTIGFKRHLAPHVVDGEAVYLVSERGVSVVNGQLAGTLAPLLDGTRSPEEISAQLAGEVPAERVARALNALDAGGWITEIGPDPDPHAAAFFEMAGLHGAQVVTALGAASVRVETYGELEVAELTSALDEAGVNRTEDPDADTFVIAVTDDYLHPGLAERNRQALATGRPWLIVRPTGAVVWAGPVFDPTKTGCWECLAHRLAGNRQSLRYLQDRLGNDRPIDISMARLPSTRAIGLRLAALEAVKWLAGVRTGEPAVLTLDTLRLSAERHELTRRPQCPACGDPQLMAARALEPVRFESRPKLTTGDGGHRALTPDDLLAKYGRHVSPVTGVVTGLAPVTNLPAGLKMYVAGQNMARKMSDLRHLRLGLRSASCGKGKSDSQARASAFGEAVERYSAVFQGDEASRRASLVNLGEEAIHPGTMQLFSQAQYDERDRWNAAGSTFNSVPERFDETRAVDFSPVWSVTAERPRWVPTQLLYYGYPHVLDPYFGAADSNGNAAGASLEDAVLQGFFELVERDAVAMWWYNRVRRPAVDLDAFADPYLDLLRQTYDDLHRQVWALDLTNDFGIPVVGAFSRRVDGPTEDILVAFGAHFDPGIAVLRAMTEMNQFLGPVAKTGKGDGQDYVGADPEQRRWWRTATLENQPYLAADPALPAATPTSRRNMASDDLVDDLATVRRLVDERGLELLVLDQTRPDVGLPVVKVMVPGMRHFWARFAPGRLYDVPVRLGWQATPVTEADLNPIPIFI